MGLRAPAAELDARFSSEGARPAPWREAQTALAGAEVFWISTVRSDGRPHVTPLIAVWLRGALYFTTGAREQKARNLDGNSRCVLTTGCNALGKGLDLAVEGRAARVSEDAKLRRIARLYRAKYGRAWRFTVRNGHFVHGGEAHEGSVARVYEVAPRKLLAFRKGREFSQTRWRFGRAEPRPRRRSRPS
jgi:hypothetical protein